jgi:hypothetical protein
MKTVNIEYNRIKTAQKIEDILCLGTLIAVKKLPSTATLEDANEYYFSLKNLCSGCKYHEKCLACIINEW